MDSNSYKENSSSGTTWKREKLRSERIWAFVARRLSAASYERTTRVCVVETSCEVTAERSVEEVPRSNVDDSRLSRKDSIQV